MSSEFRENLSAIASFIKETGGVTTTFVSVLGGVGAVLILSLNHVEPGAWAIAVITGTCGIGAVFDPNKSSSIVQQQFQRPVDNVAVTTPSSGSITNVADVNVSPPAEAYRPQTANQYIGSDSTTDDGEWLSPSEAAKQFR